MQHNYSRPGMKGVTYRARRAGPEAELVDEFLSALPLNHARDSRVTILHEPGLGTGFPDLVLVVWREQRTRAWPAARLDLAADDFRVLQYLRARKRVPHIEFVQVVGRRKASATAERLLAAGVASNLGDVWKPASKRIAFAATKIVAVEAKLDNWSAVVQQARANSWFASKSYVLVPRATADQVAEAQKLGLGVVTVTSSGTVEVPAAQRALPRSYASWVVNDLAWRAYRMAKPKEAP